MSGSLDRPCHEQVENGHAHGDAIGDLLEYRGARPVGDIRSDFRAAVDRAGMEDERIGFGAFHALGVQLVMDTGLDPQFNFTHGIFKFPLLAHASVTYGRRVAFLGADTEDQATNAQSFLVGHRVAYPSYQASTEALSSLAAFEGVPTTMFFDRSGKLVYLHEGQYEAQGTLDRDIERYAPSER